MENADLSDVSTHERKSAAVRLHEVLLQRYTVWSPPDNLGQNPLIIPEYRSTASLYPSPVLYLVTKRTQRRQTGKPLD